MERERPEEKFVEVRVITTSGVFPDKGFERVSEEERVAVLLMKAAKALRLTDTSGWVAVAGGSRLTVDGTFRQNQLHGRVEIDWGPDHGGGGSHA